MISNHLVNTILFTCCTPLFLVPVVSQTHASNPSSLFICLKCILKWQDNWVHWLVHKQCLGSHSTTNKLNFSSKFVETSETPLSPLWVNRELEKFLLVVRRVYALCLVAPIWSAVSLGSNSQSFWKKERRRLKPAPDRKRSRPGNRRPQIPISYEKINRHCFGNPGL